MVNKSTGMDSVTIHQPPNLVHFDPSACLKTKDMRHLWNYPGFPYGQQPGPFSACSPKDSPVSLPATALQIGVLFADFCGRYEISLSPRGTNWLYSSTGLAVATLTTEDWKEEKFFYLGWKASISAQKQFIRDVKDGSWFHI